MGCCCSSTKKGPALELVIKIVEAELTKNFDEDGELMDPYVRVYWVAEDGVWWEFCVTHPHVSGHMHPVWNSSCAPVRIDEACAKATLWIDVLELDEDDTSDHCGRVKVPLARLLELHRERPDQSSDTWVSKLMPFGLVTHPEGDPVGRIHLQVTVSPPQPLAHTEVDQALFHSPVERLGVSGGTAPFFSLVLRDKDPEESTYWIGKDLSHARDEIEFYESALSLQRTDPGTFGPLLGFAFPYLGVVPLRERRSDANALDHTQVPPRSLLVLRNLFHRMKKLRLLDIKIGEATAAAEWKGKSRFAAIRQSLVDGVTNSAAEGFRLEGFDNEPESLKSQDPLLDFKQAGDLPDLPQVFSSSLPGSRTGSQLGQDHLTDPGGRDPPKKPKPAGERSTSSALSKTAAKRARRIMLQRMKAQEMLYYFSDTHIMNGWPLDPRGKVGEDLLQSWLSPAEAMEMILAELVDQLVQLALACRALAVPQKWIGSSVALGFDAGRLYDRHLKPAELRAELRRYIHCNIFDWGRSELLSTQRFLMMPSGTKEDRAQYWQNYCGGIDRLSFELCLFYCSRYEDRVDAWKEVIVTIMDFDSHSAHDFLARVVLPLQETEETSVSLERCSGAVIPNATLTYWIGKHSCPGDTKIKEVWWLHIVGATNLPASPRNPDAFAVVRLRPPEYGPGQEADESRVGAGFGQQTKTLPNQCNPMWRETFEFPVMKRGSCSSNPFLHTLRLQDADVTMDKIRAIASSKKGPFMQWKDVLDKAAQRESSGKGPPLEAQRESSGKGPPLEVEL